MSDHEDEHALAALIKAGYSPPLPEKPFVESLGASLCRELQSLPGQSEQVAQLPRRRPAAAMRTVVGSVIRHRHLALATAATVVVALLALPFVVPQTTDEQSGGAGVPSGEAELVTVPPQPSKRAVRPPSPTSAGERRPEEDVAAAPVIVRAKATGRTRATVEYRVTKVFKGRLTENLITVQIPEALAGTPYDAEKKYAIGQEVILFLSNFRKTEQGAIWNASSWWYDVAPGHRLDDREKIIFAAIAKAPPADADGLAAQPDRTAKGRTRGDGRAVRAKSRTRTRGVARSADRARTPPGARPAPWNQIDTTPLLVASSGSAIVAMSPKAEGRLPLSTRVAKSSAVVRCTMIELTDTHLVCRVTRVIYGRVPGDLLRVRDWGLPDIGLGAAQITLRRQLGREPTRAELQAYSLRSNRFRVGRDVILFLDQCRQTDAGAEFHCVALRFDQGPRDSLDDCDKKIMELVTNGAYLMPKPTIFLDQYLMASERVVRAELKKIGGTSAERRVTEWRVTGVVHVNPPGREGFSPRALTKDELEAYAKQTPATITVGLDPWRLRAEAIVRYRAAQEPGQAPTEERIQAEFTRLVGAELTVGQEAILMLRPRENARDKNAFKLVGIVRSDPDKARNVDQLEKTIREMIYKGFPAYL